MNFLYHFVDSPLAAAIGWTLLHSVWEGALVAALFGAVLVATRSPRARYSAACIAMLLSFGAFSITLILFLPHHSSSLQAFKPLAVSAWHASSAGEDANLWTPRLALLAPWLAPLWIAGVLALYLRSLASCLSVQSLRCRGVCSAQAPWQSSMVRLTARLRISRPVVLLESSLAEVPMVLGHFKPLILIPVGLLAGLSAAQVEAILLHELTHIRRNDYLINAFQLLLEGLLFYHPAVWWISHVARAERENCCDDLVVSITGNAHEYARTLATLEQFRSPIAEPAIALTGGHLMKRIHRLLYPQVPSGPRTPWLAASILVLAGAVSIAAWPSKGAQHAASARQASQDTSKTPTAPDGDVIHQKQLADEKKATRNSYSKWLNEDVVYIIDDAERSAFEKLTTNAERDEFIKQFWERRNPNPESSTNKFKDEHYRRIAFTNQRFGTASGTPGWQTDRGHIYIVYGPPDEIDSHPKDEGGSPKPAIEVWSYRHIDGLGANDSITFIDRTGRGDYHLAPSNIR
jgi:GWxTD domain-containing protein